MDIKIISGAYGMRPSDRPGTVKTIRAGQTCDVSPEEARRLVGLGVAAYVQEDPKPPVATPPSGEDSDGEGANTPAPKNSDKEPGEATLDPEQLKTLTNPKLVQLGVDLGLPAASLKGKNKTQLIEAITAIGVNADDDGEDEAPPDLGAEPPVQ